MVPDINWINIPFRSTFKPIKSIQFLDIGCVKMNIIKEAILQQKVEFASILLGAACILLSFLDRALEWAIAVPIVICGIPIVWGAIVGVVKEHDITADVLVSIAIVASIFIGEYDAAAEVAVIMQIGAFLEEATVNHANNCIRHLNGMNPTEARIVRDGVEEKVPIDRVDIGDTVRVLPGESVPTDGSVLHGNSSIDTSIITGESTPVDVAPGDTVSAGTINMYGAIDVRVDRIGEDSTLARMAKLIEDADAGRSKIVRTADRWAVYIVVIALSVAIATYLVTRDIYRSVTVLVVFCPCALILATPTAIMAAAGNLSKHGILVRDGGSLERLSGVDTVLFDKTGTLTTGKVVCAGIVSCTPSVPAGELASAVATVESLSEHPLGKAMARFSDHADGPEDFTYTPGRGVCGKVGGSTYFAGNRAFISENCPEDFGTVNREAEKMEKEGYTVVHIGKDGRTVGYAMLSDTLRPTSKYAVRHLRMLHIKSIMLTGDSRFAAEHVSNSLGTDDVVWECLPSDKLKIVSDIDRDGKSCMVGDGVNDAPSLKRASVGISVCNAGNDIAMESSDIVFMDNDLSKLPGLINMSKRTLLTIRAGIAFSLTVNTVAMALAVLGLIGPVAGALVHNIGSVIVIIAAAMLLRYDPWRPGRHKKRPAGPVAD